MEHPTDLFACTATHAVWIGWFPIHASNAVSAIPVAAGEWRILQRTWWIVSSRDSLIRRAREFGAIRKAQSGAVSFIQRFSYVRFRTGERVHALRIDLIAGARCTAARIGAERGSPQDGRGIKAGQPRLIA